MNKAQSASSSGACKYDDTLRELELQYPALLRHLLDKYSADMKIFGYTWHNVLSCCNSVLIGTF